MRKKVRQLNKYGVAIVFLLLVSAIAPLYGLAKPTSKEMTVTFNIVGLSEEKIPDEPLFVAIHDLNVDLENSMSKRLFAEVVDLPLTVTLPVSETYNKHDNYEFFIKVGNMNYSGSKIVQANLKSNKKISVDVNLLLTKQSTESLYERPEVQTRSDSYDYDYDWNWVLCGEVHSISGVTAKWYTTTDTTQYFEGYSRDIWYRMQYGGYVGPTQDSDWGSAGKKATDSSCGDYVSVSGGTRDYVRAYTRFKCEEWYYDNEWMADPGEYYWDHVYLLVTPLIYNALEDTGSPSCAECGGTPPGYAAYQTSGGANPFEVEFDDGDSSSSLLSSGLSMSFSLLTVGPISLSATCDLYEDMAGDPPYVEITVTSWNDDQLYYWYDDDDADRFLIHLSWD